MNRPDGLDWKKKADIIHRVLVEKKWRVYSQEDCHFLTLSLCGEVGELANRIKKDWRGDIPINEQRKEIEEEMADVRMLLEVLAIGLEVDLDEVCERKILELFRRWPQARQAVDLALDSLRPAGELRVICDLCGHEHVGDGSPLGSKSRYCATTILQIGGIAKRCTCSGVQERP